MAETLNNDSEIKINFIIPENMKNTQSIIQEFSDYTNNKEVLYQSEILSNLKGTFNRIAGISSELRVYSVNVVKGKCAEDGTITTTISPEGSELLGLKDSFLNKRFKIGAEFKWIQNFNNDRIDLYTKEAAVQSIDYQVSFEKYGESPYDIVLVGNNIFLRLLYRYKNKDTYEDLKDVLYEYNSSNKAKSPCGLWKDYSDVLSPICDRFIWEDPIFIDENFSFDRLASKILNDLTIIYKWK